MSATNLDKPVQDALRSRPLHQLPACTAQQFQLVGMAFAQLQRTGAATRMHAEGVQLTLSRSATVQEEAARHQGGEYHRFGERHNGCSK